MSLSELRDYAAERGDITLKELSVHFNLSPGHIQNMMSVWIRKGVFSENKPQSKCSSCSCECAEGETVYHLNR
ncbi:FeoC-like transcriptional regulator [Vibrio salinus]|uniref:FeoC-like transcriptional regulator n=1 Tax=Vibrio salinus TaxID=2899784 RepID=UPI001E3B6826|nr:FeoC-like transcriptional regulator [Vibrio salinus]MCE0495005.1 FeoC-like transcriptional regulator [Vibrio salinus]